MAGMHKTLYGEAMIWQQCIDISQLNEQIAGTLMGDLGMVITKLGDDFLCGEMPVAQRHLQPRGIMHGGLSCVMAEGLGSIAANLSLVLGEKIAVGTNLAINHLRPVYQGQLLEGRATPVQIGKKLQVWNIDLFAGPPGGPTKLASTTRLTVANIPPFQ